MDAKLIISNNFIISLVNFITIRFKQNALYNKKFYVFQTV